MGAVGRRPEKLDCRYLIWRDLLRWRGGRRRVFCVRLGVVRGNGMAVKPFIRRMVNGQPVTLAEHGRLVPIQMNMLFRAFTIRQRRVRQRCREVTQIVQAGGVSREHWPALLLILEVQARVFRHWHHSLADPKVDAHLP